MLVSNRTENPRKKIFCPKNLLKIICNKFFCMYNLRFIFKFIFNRESIVLGVGKTENFSVQLTANLKIIEGLNKKNSQICVRE